MEEKFRVILQFAIQKEAEFCKFYLSAAQRARFQRIKSMFSEMAADKEKQQKLLEEINQRQIGKTKVGADFDLNDYAFFEEVKFSPAMSYKEIHRTGVQLEEYSLKFYKNLEKSIEDERLKGAFSELAEGVAVHIQIFEDQEFGK